MSGENPVGFGGNQTENEELGEANIFGTENSDYKRSME